MNKTDAREAWLTAANAYTKDPEAVAALAVYTAVLDRLRDKYKPAVDKARDEYLRIEQAAKSKPKKARWPDNIPLEVLKTCQLYWSGTEELKTFRIHCWNDTCIVTSYPNRAYWTNGGKNKGSTCYFVISRKRIERSLGGAKPMRLCRIEGRVSPKQQADILLLHLKH